jgi:hypothetical protein
MRIQLPKFLQGLIAGVCGKLQTSPLATDAEYTTTATLLKDIKAAQEQVEEEYRGPISDAHKLHHELCAERSTVLLPLVENRNAAVALICNYEAVLEKRRLEMENAARAALIDMERDRKESEALALEAEGRRAEADVVRKSDVVIQPVVIQPSTPTTFGVSHREIWKYRIDDEKLIPREFLMPDEKKIGAYAKAMKAAGRIPGVTIFSELSVQARV